MRTTARLLTGTALAAAATVLTAGGATAAFAGGFEAAAPVPYTARGGTALSNLSNPAAPATLSDFAALAAPCGPGQGAAGDTQAVDTEPGTARAGTAEVGTAEPLGTYGVPLTCENGTTATGDTLADSVLADPSAQGDLVGGQADPSALATPGLLSGVPGDRSEPGDPNGHDRGGSEPDRHQPDGRDKERDKERDHGRDGQGWEGHKQDGRTPRGHVNTGVGGSVAPDTTQIAVGAAVLAVAAVGGVRLLRRRASGAQGS